MFWRKMVVFHGIPGLVNIQKAIENGPVEIVDFPINSMVIFQFAMLNYQRVFHGILMGKCCTALW